MAEKVLLSAKTFANTFHQVRAAEEQEMQMGQMHGQGYFPPVRKESTGKGKTGKPAFFLERKHTSKGLRH